MEFFSSAPQALTDFADGQGTDLRDAPIESPREVWFSAEDGLKTVRALMLAVGDRNIEHALAIIDDLREFMNVLHVAGQNGVRWHLAVDF